MIANYGYRLNRGGSGSLQIRRVIDGNDTVLGTIGESEAEVFQHLLSLLETQAHTITQLEAQIVTHKMVLNQYSENLNVRDATIAELEKENQRLAGYPDAVENMENYAKVVELESQLKSALARVERVKTAIDNIHEKTCEYFRHRRGKERDDDGRNMVYEIQVITHEQRVQDAAQEGKAITMTDYGKMPNHLTVEKKSKIQEESERFWKGDKQSDAAQEGKT